MSQSSLEQRLLAEPLWTALLPATVVGSGIMAERLSEANAAVALLSNSLATGAILVVLVPMFAPVSGFHYDPVVTLAFVLGAELPWQTVVICAARQLAARVLGVSAAQLMFDRPMLQDATKLGAGYRPFCRRPLYHRSLLVRRLDLLRRSGRHGRAFVVRHICRHCARQCGRFRCCANPWRMRRGGGCAAVGIAQHDGSALNARTWPELPRHYCIRNLSTASA